MVSVIVLSGAQNSGKSTQMKYLARELRKRKYRAMWGFIVPQRRDGSISRRAVDHGFKINENGNFDTQHNICLGYSLFDMETRKYAEQRNFDFLIVDRSILDHTIYCNSMENISREDKAYVTTIGLGHAYRFRVKQLWVCEPISKLDVDGYRSGNKSFQDSIHREFVENIIHKKMGENLLKDYVEKRIAFLPNNEHFSKEESIRIRNEIILKAMEEDGLL